MATLQGVMDALTAQIRAAVPAGYPFVCYSGWVTQEALKYEVAGQAPQGGTWVAGRSHITVYDLPAERNTTRFTADWKPTGNVTPKLVATTSSNTITFSGAPDPGGNIAVTVNQDAPVLYQETSEDTLESIAANVAAAINSAALEGITTSAAGKAVAVTGAPSPALDVLVGATGTLVSIARQQEKDFMVTVWAPTPAARAALADGADAELGTMNFLPLPNDYPARIQYKSTRTYEPQFNAQVYRRDLVYSVEFALTRTTTGTQIVATPTTLGQL